ncbi:conserved Plasmodium protein, unknown function [Plasmodium sp. gorilla clade G3]|nr:conserved Plasmodium protein, unknown function [Plasmodium sp. gorilla clade G3]
MNILISLGNDIINSFIGQQKKGDISRMFLEYFKKKNYFDEWIKISYINSYISEKNNIILIQPITSIFDMKNISIKNILNYINYNHVVKKNICLIIPDIYRPIGKYKIKTYVKIHENLGSDFYNILHANIINNLKDYSYINLCFGIHNNIQNNDIPTNKSIQTYFKENINEQENKIIHKSFQLANEHLHKLIFNTNIITTNFIHEKQKYPAMEPRKNFRKDTSNRRYILDVYKHMYK